MATSHFVRHCEAGIYAPQKKPLPRQYLTIAVFSASMLAWVLILWASGVFA
jgi:hypothetical protein